jgi:hypothetical protein
MSAFAANTYDNDVGFDDPTTYRMMTMLASIRKQYLEELELARLAKKRFEYHGRYGISFDEDVLRRSRAYAIWMDLLDEFFGRTLGKAVGKLLKVYFAVYFAQIALSGRNPGKPNPLIAPSATIALQSLLISVFITALVFGIFLWYRRDARKSWEKYEAGFDDYARLDDLMHRMNALVRLPGSQANPQLASSLTASRERLKDWT